jgi:hypothetical protein
MRLGAALLLATLLLDASTASGERAIGTVKSFRTPSGNIGCVYSTSGSLQGSRAALRCDIRSGLKPKPVRPRNCDLDWGDSYELARNGRAIVVCHGDTAIDPRAKVIAYGKTWRTSPFTCASLESGLRCKNGSGHGFFLSREHSYRF